MPTLIIETKSGKQYQSRQPMHFMVAEEFGVDCMEVVRVGIVSRGRIVWSNRKPH